MINRRALVGSLIFAAFGTLLLLVYLRRFEQEMSGGERLAVVTVVRAVERGQTLTEDMLATREVPVAYIEDRAVKASERSKVLGLPVSVSLAPQQSLMWTDLAVTTQERDLSKLIAPGKRGVTVRASSASDTRGNSLIRPGDYVDVIVTTFDSAQAKDLSASVLLQRVLVLAVGEETSTHLTNVGCQQAPSWLDEKLLTLSLSLSEAQLLSLALERGKLSVAVRNAQDPAVQGDIPDVTGAALLNREQRVPAGAKRNVGPVAIGGSK